MHYVVPVLLTIPANSYSEAQEKARTVEHLLTHDGRVKHEGITAEVESYFEHDNIGQRVLYLHPEEDPDYENTKDEDDNG